MKWRVLTIDGQKVWASGGRQVDSQSEWILMVTDRKLGSWEGQMWVVTLVVGRRWLRRWEEQAQTVTGSHLRSLLVGSLKAFHNFINKSQGIQEHGWWHLEPMYSQEAQTPWMRQRTQKTYTVCHHKPDIINKMVAAGNIRETSNHNTKMWVNRNRPGRLRKSNGQNSWMPRSTFCLVEISDNGYLTTQVVGKVILMQV